MHAPSPFELVALVVFRHLGRGGNLPRQLRQYLQRLRPSEKKGGILALDAVDAWRIPGQLGTKAGQHGSRGGAFEEEITRAEASDQSAVREAPGVIRRGRNVDALLAQPGGGAGPLDS